MEILKKLQNIQTAIVVKKSKYNEFADFDYRSCEDILQALKPHLTKQGCIIKLDDELINMGEKIYIKAIASIIDTTDGQAISATAFAQEPPKAKAKMDESQTTGSTSSYARKYALNGLLALDDNADPDKINNGKNKTPAETKLITKVQIEELKKLGFDDARLDKMVKYYKLNKLEELTFKQADEAIKKQKRAQEKAKDGAKNEKK